MGVDRVGHFYHLEVELMERKLLAHFKRKIQRHFYHLEVELMERLAMHLAKLVQHWSLLSFRSGINGKLAFPICYAHTLSHFYHLEVELMERVLVLLNLSRQ